MEFVGEGGSFNVLPFRIFVFLYFFFLSFCLSVRKIFEGAVWIQIQE